MSFLQEDFLAGCDPEPILDIVRPHLRDDLDTLSQLSLYELEGYMGRTLLRDCDIMSMAHSLEVRPILLDHVLAEFAFALPSHHKLNARGGKAIFAEALRDLLPPSILERPKRGFELPLLRWLAGPLRERASDAFASSWAKELFSTAFLADAQRRLPCPEARDFRLWPYFILLAWLDQSGMRL